MPPERQPWPMKWIIVVIVAVAVPYTFLTLHYRRPGPAFRPYEDMKNRANVARLLEAGYRRISIPTHRVADDIPVRAGARVRPLAGGLPADLAATLVEVPQLPVDITNVTAASIATTVQAYRIRFACTLPGERQQLAGADLYLRGDNVVLTPTFEPLAGGLQARSPQSEVLLTIPAGTLAAGTYTFTLVGARSAAAWQVEVK